MMAAQADSVAGIAGIGRGVLRGERRSFRIWPFLGPAFIACVAYIDPGNFATNIAGGSKYGYTLLWVIVASNLMAMLIQTLSAKLGIATGRNLPLGISLFPAALITGVTAFAILGLQRFGFRPFEATIAAIVGVIGVCYLGELFSAKPPLGTVARHAVVPQFAGGDVVLAMTIAGLINMAMLVMAASVFYGSGLVHVESLDTAYKTLKPILGGSSSTLFALALLASGLSSSTVGTLSGQVVMQG